MRKGYFYLLDEFIDRDDLNSMEKLCLVGLARHADVEGHCWPSMTRIAKNMSCHVNTARRAVKSLTDKGIITFRERVDETGDQTSHLYQIPTSAVFARGVLPQKEGGTTSLVGGVLPQMERKDSHLKDSQGKEETPDLQETAKSEERRSEESDPDPESGSTSQLSFAEKAIEAEGLLEDGKTAGLAAKLAEDPLRGKGAVKAFARDCERRGKPKRVAWLLTQWDEWLERGKEFSPPPTDPGPSTFEEARRMSA